MRLCLILLLLLASPLRADDSLIEWERSDAAAFERAEREQRFVLLYLEAVWCHWCHVMDQKTYRDPAVIAALSKHFVALRIDQDARPDLAARYRDYGWPATIVFAPDGREILKRQGYIAPGPMSRLLAAILADPSPEALAREQAAEKSNANTDSGLDAGVRSELERRHRAAADPLKGGLATAQKYLDRDSVEWSLTLGFGSERDVEERRRALKTLDAARALIDPVWGGVYQYSTGGDWQHPHFEKLTTLQGEYLRVYALARGLSGESKFLDAARAIRRYVEAFQRSPDGGYFVSQDADPVPGQHGGDYFELGDKARRARGVPRIDTHRYPRETASIAEGLLALYEVTGDGSALDDARAALDWLVRERSVKDGGFRHDEPQDSGSFLADNVATGSAMLRLYGATGERVWLQRAASTGRFIEQQFRAAAGYASAKAGAGPIAPVAQIDENIALARFANRLSRATGNPQAAVTAKYALAYLAAPAVALERLTEAGVLLADREINSDPLHLTIVGAKGDVDARALHDAALRIASTYKRLDWWDRAEGPLPNPDVTYPPLKRAAAFVCTDRVCSTPITRPQDIAKFVDEVAHDP